MDAFSDQLNNAIAYVITLSALAFLIGGATFFYYAAHVAALYYGLLEGLVKI